MLKSHAWAISTLLFLTLLSLFAPLAAIDGFTFGYFASTAYFFRIVIELALPVYVFLIVRDPLLRPSLKNRVTLAVLGFLAVGSLAAAFGVNPLRSYLSNFERMGGIFALAHSTLLFLYIVALAKADAKNTGRIVVAIVSAGTLAGFNIVMVRITDNDFLFHDPFYPRAAGTFGNPIFVGCYMMIPLALAIYRLFGETTRWKRVAYGLCALVDTYAVVLSATRGAVIGMAAGVAVGAAVYVWLAQEKRVRRWTLAATSTVFVALGLLYAVRASLPQDSVFQRFFTLGGGGADSRLLQWKAALRGYTERPLLGVGPENYYLIGGKYFDPSFYGADSLWFDKPHNHLIEVLVTTGAVGLVAYLVMLAFVVGALWMGYRKGALSLAAFCTLLGGLAAFQVQSLFVFDTVMSSAAFLSLVALCAVFANVEPESPSSERGIQLQSPLSPTASLNLAPIAAAVSLAMALASIYTLNIQPIQVSRALDSARSLGAVNPVQADGYFQQVIESPYNLDPIFSSAQYNGFAAMLTRVRGLRPEFVNDVLDKAIAYQKTGAERVENDATAWQELGNLYYLKAVYNKTPPDPAALVALDRSSKLSPRRMEPFVVKSRVLTANRDLEGAKRALTDALENAPKGTLDSVDQIHLQLAMLHAYTGSPEQGLPIAEAALSHGYQPTRAEEVSWMGSWYASHGDWKNAERIFTLAVHADPTSLDDYADLARVYSGMGQKDKAIEVAQLVASRAPERRPQMTAFIDSVTSGSKQGR